MATSFSNAQTTKLDPSFGSAGTAIAQVPSPRNNTEASVVTPSGKIILAGSAGTNASLKMAVTQFNQDGSIDTSFGTDGKVFLE